VIKALVVPLDRPLELCKFYTPEPGDGLMDGPRAIIEKKTGSGKRTTSAKRKGKKGKKMKKK